MAETNYNLRALFEETFGTELGKDIELLGGYSTTVFNQVILGTFILPNEPMVSVSASKGTNTTQTLGKNVGSENNTVNIEHMADTKFSITIEGYLINETINAYPSVAVARLVSLFRRKEAIPIISPLLLTMGIREVVLENLSLKEYEGAIHVQPYTISCIDDSSKSFDVINTLKTALPGIDDKILTGDQNTANSFQSFIKFIS